MGQQQIAHRLTGIHRHLLNTKQAPTREDARLSACLDPCPGAKPRPARKR